MLYPDATTFIQLFLFLGVYIVFSKVFFAPYITLLDARDAAQGVEVASADAEAPSGPNLVELEALRQRVNEATQALHVEASEYRSEQLSVAQKSSQEVLADSTKDAGALIAQANEKVGAVRADVTKTLESSKSELLTQIEAKLVAA